MTQKYKYTVNFNSHSKMNYTIYCLGDVVKISDQSFERLSDAECAAISYINNLMSFDPQGQ